MSLNKKRLLIGILLAVWVAVWMLFLIRPYTKKDLMKSYSDLLRLDLDGKRAYVTGEDLYRFLALCSDSTGRPCRYELVGLEEDPLALRRAVYYLYPDRPDPAPEFIFVYKKAGYSRKGYITFKEFGADEYILQRT